MTIETQGETVVYSSSAPQFSVPDPTVYLYDVRLLFDKLIRVDGSVNEIADRIIYPLISEKLSKSVVDFISVYGEQLKNIREKGWHFLSKELGDAVYEKHPPHNLTYDQIRHKANKLVNKIVRVIARNFHLHRVVFKDYGTLGPFSDIDYSLCSKMKWEHVPPEDAVIFQTMRDLVNVRIFGGLSSYMFDTQCYTPHLSSFKLADQIFSIRGKHQHVAFEITLCLLQAKILYRETPERFAEFQRKFCAVEDAHLRDTFQCMFSAVNAWRDQLDSEVLSRSNSEGRYKQEMFAYTLPIKMMVARKTSKYEKKMIAYRTLLEDVKPKEPLSIQRYQMHLEEQTFAFMLHYSVLKSLEQEPTLSSSEGTVTLEAEDSQKHQKDVIEAKRQFRVRSASMPVIKKAPSPIRRRHEKIVAKELTPDKYKQPSIQVLKIAALEEMFQFDELISRFLRTKDHLKAQEGAITAGKYALRNTHNNLRALHQYRVKAEERNIPLSPKFHKLLERTYNLAKVAKTLERCKRRQTLSKEVLLEILSEQLSGKKGPPLQPRGKSLIYRQLNKIFSKYERLGDTIGEKYMDIRENKEHLFLHIISELSQKKFIETFPGINRPKDPKVECLLRAWVGPDTKIKRDKNLRKIFDIQDKLTLLHHSLLLHEDVVAFRDELVQNDFEIMLFLLSEGYMLRPFASKEQLDFLKVWNTAKGKVREMR